ncbi:YxlC family protein [Tumebacillus lipolyticus]|uniref:YxlC family protein n=1 Tax=Tumebacillus lipolyticus TaxID=1280370 RepID=A0ABW5A3L6_9BACL
MSANDEQNTLDELNRGLRSLDDLHPVYTPDLQWFQAQILAEKKKLRRRLIQDLLLFWLVAAVIFTVTLTLFTQSKSLYLILQALATLVPAVWLLRARKRVDAR